MERAERNAFDEWSSSLTERLSDLSKRQSTLVNEIEQRNNIYAALIFVEKAGDTFTTLRDDVCAYIERNGYTKMLKEFLTTFANRAESLGNELDRKLSALSAGKADGSLPRMIRSAAENEVLGARTLTLDLQTVRIDYAALAKFLRAAERHCSGTRVKRRDRRAHLRW